MKLPELAGNCGNCRCPEIAEIAGKIKCGNARTWGNCRKLPEIAEIAEIAGNFRTLRKFPEIAEKIAEIAGKIAGNFGNCETVSFNPPTAKF